jgi:hypothetical protein
MPVVAPALANRQVAFVRWYEEPTLRRRYHDYRRAVPRWLRRRTPWAP